jgi:hypothetical protein
LGGGVQVVADGDKGAHAVVPFASEAGPAARAVPR